MKVFLPTDFSSNAQEAAEFGIELFGLDGVEYSLLTLYHEPHAAATSMISLVEVAMKDAMQSLRREESRLKEKFGSRLHLQAMCEYGEGGGQIGRLADRHAADIIILSTKGASGLKEILIGSVAASTVQKSNVPVLVLPDATIAPRLRKAVVALDANSDAGAIEKFRAIANALEADYRFASFVSEEKMTTVGVAQKPSILRHEDEFSTVTGVDLVEALSEAAAKIEADFVVMFPGRHGFFERLFKKSNSALFAMHAGLPLLTIRKGKAD